MAGPQYIWHLDYYLSGDSLDAFADYDPERLADELCTAQPNIVAIFALNQHGYAYYPSQVDPHPRLGGRDYTGTRLEALHRRGVRV
ncbi:MAG TPA: beta-galactosidase, partial [Chloroflexota bacterium]|nr:beta-galactosidase [Chloroflexota bacterium]